MKEFRLTPASLALAFAAFGFIESARAADRPNIIYIMSDDHTSQAIGAYGGRLAKLNPTPTIDRLAKEGMLFENRFVTNFICTPSRACVLIGQYNHINKVYELTGKLEPARQFLPIEMKKAGYQTAIIGKWHLDAEPAAFDYYCVLPGQGTYFGPKFLVRGDKPWPQNVIQREGQHVTDATLVLVLDWMKAQRDPAKPFFLMYHNKAPHDMFEYAPRYEGYLKDIDIPEPESLWKQPAFGSLATRGYQDELLPYIGTSIGDRNLRHATATTAASKRTTGAATPKPRARARKWAKESRSKTRSDPRNMP